MDAGDVVANSSNSVLIDSCKPVVLVYTPLRCSLGVRPFAYCRWEKDAMHRCVIYNTAPLRHCISHPVLFESLHGRDPSVIAYGTAAAIA